MILHFHILLAVMACVVVVIVPGVCQAQSAVDLPKGVRAVWDLDKAYRETTPTRERVCINGLWQWQPVDRKTDEVPMDKWGYLKVPGAWPGTSGGYLWRETQTHYTHPGWENEDLRRTDMAWY